MGAELDTTDPDLKYYVLNKVAEEYLTALMGTEGIFIRVGNMMFNRRDMNEAVSRYAEKANRHLLAYLKKRGAFNPATSEMKVITRTIARMYEVFKEQITLRKKSGETRDNAGYVKPTYTDYTIYAVVGHDAQIVKARSGELTIRTAERIYVIVPEVIDIAGTPISVELGDKIIWRGETYVVTVEANRYKGFVQFYAEREVS